MSRRKMGLPIAKLIVATNVNDILHRALSAGDYSAGTVTPTAEPVDGHPGSEQFRAAAVRSRRRATAQRSPSRCAASRRRKAMRLTNAQREGAAALFASDRIDLDDMALAMRWACEQAGAGDRSAHRDRPCRRAPRRSAGRRAGGDAGDRAPGQVPRRGRARDRRAPAAARRGSATCSTARSATRRCPATFEAVTAYIAERATPRAAG